MIHLAEPYSCRACRHHTVYSAGTLSERLACLADPHGVSCVFARAADGYGSCPSVDGKPKNFERAA
jgi:hypothetical protein